MGKKIGNKKTGVARLFADAYRNLPPVRADNKTMQGKGDTRPLIGLDAPVIMSVKKSHAGIFIKGPRFKVQPRGVDMSGNNGNTLGKTLLPDGTKNHGLAPAAEIHFIAAFYIHALLPGNKSFFFRQGHGGAYRFPFSFRVIEKRDISLAILIRRFDFLRRQKNRSVFTRKKKFVFYTGIHTVYLTGDYNKNTVKSLYASPLINLSPRQYHPA